MFKIILLFTMYLSLQTMSIDIKNYSSAKYKTLDTEIMKISNYYKQDYELIEYIFDVCKMNNIDPILFTALIYIESSFIENAKSHTGAIGYCQITKIAMLDLETKLNRHNSRENILIGAMFLSKLINRYDNITNALIHYNVGTENVEVGGVYARKVFREFGKINQLF